MNFVTIDRYFLPDGNKRAMALKTSVDKGYDKLFKF